MERGESDGVVSFLAVTFHVCCSKNNKPFFLSLYLFFLFLFLVLDYLLSMCILTSTIDSCAGI